MSPFHITEQPNGRWRVLAGNLIIWADCPTQQQAQTIADALWQFETLKETKATPVDTYARQEDDLARALAEVKAMEDTMRVVMDERDRAVGEEIRLLKEVAYLENRLISNGFSVSP